MADELSGPAEVLESLRVVAPHQRWQKARELTGKQVAWIGEIVDSGFIEGKVWVWVAVGGMPVNCTLNESKTQTLSAGSVQVVGSLGVASDK